MHFLGNYGTWLSVAFFSVCFFIVVVINLIRAGRIWLELMTIYCMALICFGVGLKLMLKSVVCDDSYESGYRRELGATSKGAYSSSYESSYGDNSSKSSNSYCNSVPKEYKTLVCLSLLVQYLSQQVSIPLHEGISEYLRHFMEYSKRSARFVFAAKAAVVSATLMLNFVPSELNSLEILIVVFFIVVVQGLIQTLENMIVHVRREEHQERAPSQLRETTSVSTMYRRTTGFVETEVGSKGHQSPLCSIPDDEAEENKTNSKEHGESYLHFEL